MEKSLLKQWQLLLVYNCYRVFCALFFLSYVLLTQTTFQFQDIITLLIMGGYLIIGILLFYAWYIRFPPYDSQVMIFGTIDILFITGVISLIASKQPAFIILLNVTVAALSILVPGRLAIFFAALASTLLIGISLFTYAYTDDYDLRTFYLSGVFGVSIFATAFTAWYLAHRVRISENIAFHRTLELAGMQKINEYIVERLHSGVILVDLERRIQFFNSVVRTFFNLDTTRSYTALSEISKVLDSKCKKFLKQISSNNTPVQTTINDPYLRLYFYAVEVDFQMAVLIFVDDMSSIAQQAQQLKLASLGRFSASIAHELRNPLGAIFHAVQLLGDSGSLNADDSRLKQLIINNCNRMNNVIKNILQLSRRQQSQPETIGFYAFMKQFIHEFSVYNQCNIEITTQDKAEVYFVFDRSQLEQVLVILCDNAIQHAENEQGQVHIMIGIKHSASNTEIFISDDGPGIPESLMFDVFEPFFSTKRTGIGMGLFIAKELCESNQARLSLQTVEKGTCFTITINQDSERAL